MSAGGSRAAHNSAVAALAAAAAFTPMHRLALAGAVRQRGITHSSLSSAGWCCCRRPCGSGSAATSRLRPLPRNAAPARPRQQAPARVQEQQHVVSPSRMLHHPWVLTLGGWPSMGAAAHHLLASLAMHLAAAQRRPAPRVPLPHLQPAPQRQRAGLASAQGSSRRRGGLTGPPPPGDRPTPRSPTPPCWRQLALPSSAAAAHSQTGPACLGRMLVRGLVCRRCRCPCPAAKPAPAEAQPMSCSCAPARKLCRQAPRGEQ